ncbi:MAG: DEAD/DEAH box helicase family protein [Hydrogenophaga sp.]|uniref:DEAD/DEAH box helicase family protein n=1 Tax=Hydrogenophaga sp. TaxID=1904254 RepID=UPI00277A48B3|nr:DEAD/DEAH box helicase family protein [Hydrogenophaga sp.]MDP2417409.1 DEAD/DEAH box helicase family protein [Hydrogenophaga sp.]MDZ4186767.1 DEAD/DEAH box helicase family protein [Hydrogenophaga sp.]
MSESLGLPAHAVDHGIEPHSLAEIRSLCERTPGLQRLWLFGSRAQGTQRARSDIDLVADAPEWTAREAAAFSEALQGLPIVYALDSAWWQGPLGDEFRTQIRSQRVVLWEPVRHAANVEELGGTQMKGFQSTVLKQLARYLDGLKKHQAQAVQAAAALRAMEGMEDLAREAADFPKKAWAALGKAHVLPPAFRDQPYSSRFDGAGRAIPNVCLKVPTGGGKTLLAAASVARVFSAYLNQHTGLVLWVVPNEAIYRQTLKTLSDRDHPYRQMLNVAGAGRVKILEKNSPLSRLDVASHLCVMVLMLQSAARQSKETLRFFRDRGNVLGFLPREDDIEAHWALLQQVPNLDAYGSPWQSAEQVRAQKGSIVKSSLGNVMRLLRPMVVIDEGHHAYSENALSTLDGFNPSFMLELSATPRVASAKGRGSNILVDVRGTDLDEAEMIKLPIHVEVRRWADWQACLAASLHQLDALQREADALQAETARYIRPILLVQVERTGADMRDAGFIHAEDAKAYLLQLGLNERQIAIKTSEKDELKQPENIDLMSPQCEVRAIITKQALQEGWDCPFAYVLSALAAGRNPAAMTQLVGRILRLPHVTKTGRDALDACYVQCFDAKTSDVVKSIKKSLEGEGMGDLAVAVHGDAVATEKTQQRVPLKRRANLAALRIFVPKVTWAEPGAARRELVYESDVLSRLDWAALNVDALATAWAPDTQMGGAQHLTIDLSILSRHAHAQQTQDPAQPETLDRARMVRALLDLAPNAWLVWDWVDRVVVRLQQQGMAESVLARSVSSLTERLRIDIEKERDRLAQAVFNQLVDAGLVQFSLRADAMDYELPHSEELLLASHPPVLQRPDARAVEKSLLEPALHTPDMNDLELAFAGYLDQKAALRWWHRNVARTQYGLQGWKRHKVYPDFVFGVVNHNGQTRTVVMETKGLQLEGNADTSYKQALLARLTQAFKDERFSQVGELTLENQDHTEVVCDLVFEGDWRGTLEHRYFSAVL